MAPIHEAARTSDVEGIRHALFEQKVTPDLLTEDAAHPWDLPNMRFAPGQTPLLIVCNHAKPEVPGLPLIPTVVKFWGHPGEYASRGHDPWNPGPVFY